MKWIFPDKNPVIKTKLADLTEIDGAIKGWGWYFAAQQQQILSNNHPVFLMMFEIQKGAPNWRTHPVFDNCWKLDSWNMKCFFRKHGRKTHNFPSTSTIQVVIKLGEPKIYCSKMGWKNPFSPWGLVHLCFLLVRNRVANMDFFLQ